MAERTAVRRPARARSRPAPLRGPSLGQRSSSGPGEPLATQVARPISSSLGVDVSSVRVHSDSAAGTAARAFGARAFALGRHVFLGHGQSSTDLPLMAHEVTHVVQQQGAPRLQLWTPVAGDSYEREAQQAASAVTRRQSFIVRLRTRPRLQRLGLSDVLDYFADKANLIPGYRMFTLMLGVNPINMSRVERTAANILRALIELIPGGGLITQALDNLKIFERVGTWVDQQLKTLGITGGLIRNAINAFLDSLSWRDIFRLGSVWDRAKKIFTDPIGRIIEFGSRLVGAILRFVREAVLRPLAKLAEGTRGYDLLKAVLGQDPITGERVPRNAETLIGGFMKLIGQQEVWENLKKANAISRAWTWFQDALSGLLGYVRAIPGMFISALQQLEIADFILIPRAFLKIARVFGGFIGSFLSWAGRQVLSLLQIIFEVLAPAAVPYLRKAAGAFSEIIRNPIRFIGNLVRAGVQGFRQFAANFLSHLRASLIQWLTGSLAGAGVYIPQAFELREIVKFVLSVLGLTWTNVRGKLVKVVGETAVKALETGFDIVVTLVREGPAAAWEKIKESLSNLKEMVMEQVMTFVRERIVQAAITRLLTSLNPAGAFIQAIIAIYNTVMFFIERLKQIAQVATSFIDSISAIAAGGIGAAAKRVEDTMAGLLTLVISFLARIVGLGKVSDAVVNIVNRIRTPIDKALDRVIEWIVAGARALGRLVVRVLRGRDERTPEQKTRDLDLAMDSAAAAVNRFSGRMVGHAVLRPLLAAIRVRYRLTRLEAVLVGSNWTVQGEINPKKDKTTSAKGGTALAIHYNPSPLDGYGRSVQAIGEPVIFSPTLLPDRETTGPAPGGYLLSGYKRGHLLPHSWSGPDTDPRNLAAISGETNNQFTRIERSVVSALQRNQDAVVRYTTRCLYAADGPAQLDAWMRTAFPQVPEGRLNGIGDKLLKLVRSGWTTDGVAALLGIDRALVLPRSDDIKITTAFYYLPRRFTITVETVQGAVSVSGGNIENHVVNPRFPARPGVPAAFTRLIGQGR
jgi:hypothetical protein